MLEMFTLRTAACAALISLGKVSMLVGDTCCRNLDTVRNILNKRVEVRSW